MHMVMLFNLNLGLSVIHALKHDSSHVHKFHHVHVAKTFPCDCGTHSSHPSSYLQLTLWMTSPICVNFSFPGPILVTVANSV